VQALLLSLVSFGKGEELQFLKGNRKGNKRSKYPAR